MKKIKRNDYLYLIIWLSHFHSGQWSRGYRLLSKMQTFYHASWTSAYEREAEESWIYKYLTDNYSTVV